MGYLINPHTLIRDGHALLNNKKTNPLDAKTHVILRKRVGIVVYGKKKKQSEPGRACEELL